MTAARPYFTRATQVAATHGIVETERAEHYAEMADAFDLHGNADAASAFRELAAEAKEKALRLAEEGEGPAPSAFRWPDMDEVIAEQDALHYLMRPYHVLTVAIASRNRALELFRQMAEGSLPQARPRARRSIREMTAYLESLRERLAATPEPDPTWDEDLDPPNFDVE